VHHKRELVKPQPAMNAAAYLSSYFVKGRRGKETLWESTRSGAMPHSIIHVSAKLTQETGCTMRMLRLRRALFYAWGERVELADVRIVANFLKTFPGSEILARDAPDRAPPRQSRPLAGAFDDTAEERWAVFVAAREGLRA
jgi:hypothetical protein